MHHHNHNPVYFTLIPSHDCEVIKLQNICWYSCSLYFKRSVVPSFVSNPSLEYIFCQQHVYRLRPYSISPRYVSTCVVAYWPKCHLLLCVYSSFITPRVSLLCKCTNWSFEADMAVSALILCHYKFIYTPIIKVPSLFHGGRCVGSPAVAIHAYLC